MRIPQVADRLRYLAREHAMPELFALAENLRRRRPIRKAEPRSRAMTPELRDQIRAYALAHPKLSQVEIGRKFLVNQGRVSEALRGFRT